jgi:hypothetical protein
VRPPPDCDGPRRAADELQPGTPDRGEVRHGIAVRRCGRIQQAVKDAFFA